MNGMVLQAQNVPAWLRLPRGALDRMLREEVGVRREMCRPDEFLLLLGKVSAEKLSPVRKHPGVPVRDLDARKDIRGILVELVLYRLADIRRNRSNVDEAGHAIIDSRGRDGSAAIGVTDEENGAANAVERPLHHSHVLFERLQAVLNRNDLMAVRLQCGDDLAEARAIGPDAVAEYDGRLDFRGHSRSPYRSGLRVGAASAHRRAVSMRRPLGAYIIDLQPSFSELNEVKSDGEAQPSLRGMTLGGAH